MRGEGRCIPGSGRPEGVALVSLVVRLGARAWGGGGGAKEVVVLCAEGGVYGDVDEEARG